ncbi:MAG: hypothetical protein ABWJ42_03415 [Sulfolobales archaeon]
MIREFANLKDLIAYIDGKLVEYRKIFGELIRYVEDLRKKAETQRRVLSVISKLGVEVRSQATVAEIDLKSVKLSINPSPEAELRYYERYLEELNQKITKLATMRKDLETISSELADLTGKIVVLMKDEIPEILIMRI